MQSLCTRCRIRDSAVISRMPQLRTRLFGMLWLAAGQISKRFLTMRNSGSGDSNIVGVRLSPTALKKFAGLPGFRFLVGGAG